MTNNVQLECRVVE